MFSEFSSAPLPLTPDDVSTPSSWYIHPLSSSCLICAHLFLSGQRILFRLEISWDENSSLRLGTPQKLNWLVLLTWKKSGFLSILYSIGSQPLQIWEKKCRNGHIRRITDNDIQSSVLEIMGTNVSLLPCAWCVPEINESIISGVDNIHFMSVRWQADLGDKVTVPRHDY